MLDELLPRLRIPGVVARGEPGAGAARRRSSPDGRPLWLEIGFGGGEHLVHQAAAHPELGLIGCEPFVNGVAMALAGSPPRARERAAASRAMRAT